MRKFIGVINMRLNILIISHYFVTGESQELFNYLKNKTKLLVYFEHPFYFSEKKYSSVVIYEKSLFKKIIKIPKIMAPEFVTYLKDVLATIYFSLILRKKFNICIAADSLNCITALLLKKIRLINKVIYFSIDYSPVRFHSNILNFLYHLSDEICCYNSDYIWNTSERMKIEREKHGLLFKKYAKQIEVPNGVNFNEIQRLDFKEIKRNNVVFMGHLVESKGIELLIKTFPKVLKSVPEAKLIIIGKGPLEKDLKKIVLDLHINDYIIFKGFITDEEVLEILTRSAIGVAPYVDDRNNLTYYSDPLKPKLYMAAGLPVIITRVPKIANEIEKCKAGFVIDYNEKQLLNSILKLLIDDELYLQCRNNAISLASKYDWNRIFTIALNTK